MNAIQSALGMVKSLLPLGTGGPLPVAPKLPDVPSFLENVSSLLQDLLGQSPQASKAPESRDSESSPKPAVEVVPAPRGSSESPKKSDDEVVRDREQSQREAERRLQEEAPADGVVVPLEQIRRILEGIEQADPAAPTALPIRDLIQALDELRKRAGLPAMEAPASETVLSPVPEPPPLGEAVAQTSAPQGPVVEVPSGDVPESGLPEVFAPVAAETPESAPLPDALAKEDPLPSIEDPAMTRTAGTDPTSETAAQGAPSTIVDAAVSPVVVPHQQQSPTPVRPEPTVGGFAESGGVRTGPSSATPAAEADSPEGRAEMIDRIVKAARLTQSRGTARIRISLSPPHLGELKVDLSVRQHVLHGTLQAENVAAKEMLLSNLQQLRDSLAEQGVQVGEFQVQVDSSFQQAMQEESDDGRPRAGAASYGRGFSEEPSGSVQERLRSARLQVLDVVA
ncbi:MAG TPA: flagellar hook-length control protein FliK [Planctomycetota bacterium]|nr:flagellar hook-length control protein FliK [Planctomycetota bacterium]